MTHTAAKPQHETEGQPLAGEAMLPEVPLEDSSERQVERIRLLWRHRKFLIRASAIGLLASTLVALMIPRSYTSTAQLMPPDQQSTSSMAMMAAMATKGAGGLGSVAGDLLGLKSSGALFVGVLKSQTAQDRLVQKFDLRKVYGKRLLTDAREKLDGNTSITEDRKSGLITINVTDHSPERAAALANAYVDELNSLVSQLSTSSAHRERVFLDERLKVAKQDLDDASNQLAQFSSKNDTLDIQQEGKAMLDAAGTIAGQLIAAESQLEGLRQVYTDDNTRVRSLNGRVAELRKQLEKFTGKGANAGDQGASSSAQELKQLSAQSGSLPYPTIRNLPLLGAKYGDYYRRAKIQETVYGLLTEQYELAKVQEAKETPSVKLLDAGLVPEKKSFPPRIGIIFLGTVLVFAGSIGWVLGSARWEQVDPQDPRRVLAQEVAGALKSRMPWGSRNGFSHEPSEQVIGDGRGNRRPPTSGPVDQ